MPDYATMAPSAPWRELRTTRADWDGADPAALESMLVSAHLIRAFEEKVLELAGQGMVHGPAHSAVGQEDGAVGSEDSMCVGFFFFGFFCVFRCRPKTKGSLRQKAHHM